MNLNQYNNVGIIALEIASVLENSNDGLSLSKALLVAPIFSSKHLNLHLARKTTNVSSIEQLITDKTSLFSNFNRRYYDCLSNSMNAIQLLVELGLVIIDEEKINLITPINYDKAMGSRMAKVYLASKNVAAVLNDNASNLYLNLRIEL